MDPPPVKWPAKWKPLADGSTSDDHVNELRREAPANHVLANVPLRTIGIGDVDDVLFELLDGSGRFAAVHLTFANEVDPEWPDTKIYDNWEHFRREGEDF